MKTKRAKRGKREREKTESRAQYERLRTHRAYCCIHFLRSGVCVCVCLIRCRRVFLSGHVLTGQIRACKQVLLYAQKHDRTQSQIQSQCLGAGLTGAMGKQRTKLRGLSVRTSHRSQRFSLAWFILRFVPFFNIISEYSTDLL